MCFLFFCAGCPFLGIFNIQRLLFYSVIHLPLFFGLETQLSVAAGKQGQSFINGNNSLKPSSKQNIQWAHKRQENRRNLSSGIAGNQYPPLAKLGSIF